MKKSLNIYFLFTITKNPTFNFAYVTNTCGVKRYLYT